VQSLCVLSHEYTIFRFLLVLLLIIFVKVGVSFVCYFLHVGNTEMKRWYVHTPDVKTETDKLHQWL
jgi:hypothetical protein